MSQQNPQNQNQESEARQQNPYAGYGYDPSTAYNPYAGYTDPTAAYGGYQPGQYQTPYQPQVYQQPPQAQFQLPYQQQVPAIGQEPGMLPLEQSYIENILRLNKGKLATVYMTFENNAQWNAKIFKGIIEAAGRDHLILSDPQSGMRYLLLMVYLDYVTFDEELDYEYPYAAGVPGLSAYPPR
ncbi:spore coat protein GerQ [Litchfieldia salsa]|uniref:Spore germination protein Q n=1 Tax=Litchfieldia salsa TaxID=930152 RepID=A0A1H0U787_9BACI|nr:spore coat protein GerQ [Litchfieldia salsa]SDP62024.1 spore germination protein Q [Litchfieldia salsa]